DLIFEHVIKATTASRTDSTNKLSQAVLQKNKPQEPKEPSPYTKTGTGSWTFMGSRGA
ncbi:hypothetical protein Hte_009853, partial [Hypoxylon texense]